MPTRYFLAFFGPLSFLLAVMASLSLSWQMTHDVPILVYISYLVNDIGLTPYVDVFDFNTPGTYAVFSLSGLLFGYDDISIRIFDLLYLSITLISTFLLMRRFGWQTAWAACVLFGLLYLGSGHSMQREYLLLLPTLWGVMLSPAIAPRPTALKSIISGICFGVAATIKPHALIVVAALLLHGFLSRRKEDAPPLREHASHLGAMFAGSLIPIAVMLGYLWQAGSLPAFLDIATNYWPLYGRLDSDHRVVTGLDRVVYTVKHIRELGRHGLWLLPVGAGVYVSLFRSTLSDREKSAVVLLGGAAISFAIYPALTGQFWGYHWLPFLFFAVLLSSLCLVNKQEHSMTRGERVFPAVVLLFAAVLSMQPSRAFMEQMFADSPTAQRQRVDGIADYLNANMQQGDRVQPLDWTGGAVHGMLISRANIATPFLYDFYFYHHISKPYVKQLRRRFVDALDSTNPRYVVEVLGSDKPWVSGWDTTREFPEPRAYLDLHYEVKVEARGYRVYERLAHNRTSELQTN